MLLHLGKERRFSILQQNPKAIRVLLQIIHRDLAARNVLIGERETCKVTDFGMARDVQQENIYERKTKVFKNHENIDKEDCYRVINFRLSNECC